MNRLQHIFLLISGCLFILFSCEGKKIIVNNNQLNINKIDTLSKTYLLDETFEDSINVGEKDKTKVKVDKYRSIDNEDVFVKIKFYKREQINSKEWIRSGSFTFEKDGIIGIGGEVLDFNNDGYKDFTYRSAIAARGGNEVRKLFIYNPKEKDFIYIKNSEDYPNLRYDNEMDCINSMILTGSTAYAYLHLKKDSLQEFARIEESDTLYVSEIGKDGKMHVTFKDKIENVKTDFDLYLKNKYSKKKSN